MIPTATTGTFDAAFEYVDAALGPNKFYDYNAGLINGSTGKCFVNSNSLDDSVRIAYYYNETWYYGLGNCLII